ncbi:MAG: hypothetical protein FWD70_01270 [Desulfuromonadales bacterium]|nr:hypothetical protein [Desulfuromonadales bacterium]
MDIEIYLNFFLLTSKEASKLKITKNIQELLNEKFSENVVQQLENACFVVTAEYDSWKTAIYKVLKFCQSIGKQWVITGNIESEFNVWSDNPSIIGVKSIEVNLDNSFISKSGD